MGEKILVTQSSIPSFEEYTNEIRDIWDSRWLTNMGPKHEKLRSELKSYMGVSNVELVTNGHMALEIAFQALGLKGEVITTPFTFASTTQAMVRSGLEPVFCDVDPVTFTIDTTAIERLITEKTCAIAPVHVYGNVCDVEEIERIAKKYGLKVIYDAAHTFGVKVNGKGIGSFGDVSCFSFHATKVFNSVEGGAICFGDNGLDEKIIHLKNFGISSPDTVESVGTNAKMNEFCAAMGLCNLRHVDDEIAKRKVVVERYSEHLQNVTGLQMNPVQKGVTPNYAYFPVIFDPGIFGESRDEVCEKLSRNDIYARKYFYPLTSGFECYGGKYSPDATPTAKRLSEQVLCLPLYADLDVADVDRICNVILNK